MEERVTVSVVRRLALGLLGTIALLSPMAAPTLSSAGSQGPVYLTVNSATECLSYAYACTPGYTGANASSTWAWSHYGGSWAQNANGYHNCTLYAAWRLAENGMGDPGNWGNAVDWINHTSSNHTPAVGAIAWWGSETGGGYGHVAYVEQIRGGEVFIRADNYMGTSANGYTDAGWISASSVDAFLHPHDVSGGGGGGSPTIHEGDFIQVTGSASVYRVAGGAPLYVSSWSHVGGSHPVTVISKTEFDKLRAQPRDGTFIQGWSGGAVFEIAGGAPLMVSSWSDLGGSSGKTVIAVDRAAIDNAGNGTGVWSHLRDVPADSTLIKGYGHAAVYVIAGGAPLAVSAWSHIGGQNGRSLTSVDQSAIDHAGDGGSWDHLRDVPADNTFVQPYSGNRTVYVIAGGAPLAVGDWSHVGGSAGKSVVSIDGSAVENAGEAGAWSHLRDRPADGTYIAPVTGNRTAYVVAGGAPIAISSWAQVGGSAGKSVTGIDEAAVDKAGGEGVWHHLAAMPADSTILQSGPGGPLYETRAGAPYAIAGLPAGKAAVVVDPTAIANAGGSGVWRFLRAPSLTAPAAGTSAGGPGTPSGTAAGGAGTPSGSTAGKGPTVRLLHVAMKGVRVLVVLACDGPPGRSCRGKVELVGRRRRPSAASSHDDRTGSLRAGASSAGQSRGVKLGEHHFDLATGDEGTLSIALGGTGRPLRARPVGLVIVTAGKKQVVKETIGRSRADRRHGGARRRGSDDAPLDRLLTEKGDGAGRLVTFEGFGAARWGEPLTAVEGALGVSFDCSAGAMPGVCLCPTPTPGLPVFLTFDVQGTPRLSSLWTMNPGARTARGIHVGSTPAEVVRAYPSARLRHNGIAGGLGTYYLVRRDHHALAFLVTGKKIRAMYAFADPHRGSIASERCA